MKNLPPIIKYAKPTPLQDRYCDDDGNCWNVARLIDLCKDLKPFDCPLASLDLSDKIWSNYDIDFLAFHIKKVMAADLSKPIIIAWNGSVADGRHRIIKALVEGKRTIKAVRMQDRPTPCSEIKS